MDDPAIIAATVGAVIAGAFGIAAAIVSKSRKKKPDTPAPKYSQRGGGDSQNFQGKTVEIDGNVIKANTVHIAKESDGPDETVLALADRLSESTAINALQAQEIESLKEEVRDLEDRIDEGGDKEERDALEELRQSGDSQELIRVLKKETQASDEVVLARYREIAAVAYLTGEIDEAKQALQSILSHQPDDLDAHNRLGHIHHLRGDLPQAVECYERVLSAAEHNGDDLYQAKALGNLGVVYQTRSDLDRAVESYEKALAINNELGRKEGMANNYTNLGVVYQIRGDLDRAVESYEKALDLYEELGHKEGMAANYGNLGVVYETRGNLDRAVESYEKALVLNEEPGSKEGMAIQFANLGIVYQIRGDFRRAREYWKQSVALYSEMGVPHMVDRVQSWLDALDD